MVSRVVALGYMPLPLLCASILLRLDCMWGYVRKLLGSLEAREHCTKVHSPCHVPKRLGKRLTCSEAALHQSRCSFMACQRTCSAPCCLSCLHICEGSRADSADPAGLRSESYKLLSIGLDLPCMRRLTLQTRSNCLQMTSWA